MSDCNNCKSTKEPEVSTEEPKKIPYITHDLVIAYMEREAKRMWVIILVLILLLVGSNCAWLYYESQFESVESWEIVQENEDGYNNYIGNDGDIINGETDYTENQDEAT